MNAYLALGIAIIAEVIATTALKSSDSFTRLVPSIITLIGYSTAFYFLTVTMKSIPTGVTYALWSGLGIVLISITSFVFHGQKIDLAGMLGMALIIAGGGGFEPVFEIQHALRGQRWQTMTRGPQKLPALD